MNTETLCSKCKPKKKCSFNEALDHLADRYALACTENPNKENTTTKEGIIEEFLIYIEAALNRDCPKVNDIRSPGGFERSLKEKLMIIFPN
jgi:hypothetical protein